jgi:hypothetical protein
MYPGEYGSLLVQLWYAHHDGNRQRAGHAEVEHIQHLPLSTWWPRTRSRHFQTGEIYSVVPKE